MLISNWEIVVTAHTVWLGNFYFLLFNSVVLIKYVTQRCVFSFDHLCFYWKISYIYDISWVSLTFIVLFFDEHIGFHNAKELKVLRQQKLYIFYDLFVLLIWSSRSVSFEMFVVVFRRHHKILCQLRMSW